MRRRDAPHGGPPEAPGGPPEAPGGPTEAVFECVRVNTQNVRLTRSFCALADMVPAGLECYAFCKESSTK